MYSLTDQVRRSSRRLWSPNRRSLGPNGGMKGIL